MVSPTHERRKSSRYPLQFEVEYRVFAKGHSILAGIGKTVNISSQGILIGATEGITKGQVVEVSIKWNTARRGVPLMNLEILGRVTRADDAGTAVRILRYGFHPRETSSTGPTAI